MTTGSAFTAEASTDAEAVDLWAEVARLRAELARHEAAADRRADLVGQSHTRHQDELAAHQVRSAAILESASDFAILTTDLQGRVTSWNKGAENVLGWREDEVLGRPAGMIFTPEDRAAGVPEAEMAEALREGRAGDLRWHQRQDGSPFWASGLMMPLRDDKGLGEPRGFLKILRDRTAEKRAQDALHEKAEFLERVLESSDDCIKVLGLDGRLEFMSAGGQVAMGVDDFGAIAGCPWPDVWVGEGHAAALAALVEARAGRTGRFQGRALTAKGTSKDWDVPVTPIRGPDGRPQRLLSISRDVTELKRAEDALRASEARARLLAGEMHHRVKNTLGMAQAIVAQSLRSAATPAEARESIDARLQALGRAHDLLMEDSWTASDLRAVVEVALRAHDDGQPDRLLFEGPPVALSAQVAAALALAVHELATNAAKYGALSAEEGWVSITWALTGTADGAPGEERLRFCWLERGGPPVVPPRRKGFGSRLIESGLAGVPGVTVHLAFEAAGASCVVEAPTASLRDLGPT